MPEEYIESFTALRPSFVTEQADLVFQKAMSADPEKTNLITELFRLLTTGTSALLSPKEWLRPAVALLILLCLLGICRRIFPGSGSGFIFYLAKLILAFTFLVPLYRLFSLCAQYMLDITVFFGGWIPFVGTAFAACGNISLAASENTLLLWTFSAVNILLTRLLPTGIRFFFGWIFFCAAADEPMWYGLTNAAKETLNRAIAIVTALLFLLVSFQSILSAGEDSAAMRAVKLMAATTIPIVGNSIAESLRIVSSGLSVVRAGLGTAAMLFLLGMFLPVLLLLWFARTLLGLFAAVCQDTLTEIKPMLLQFQGAFDLALAIYASVAILFLTHIGILICTKSALGAS